MLDVNKVILLGTIRGLHERSTEKDIIARCFLETETKGLYGKRHSNTHNVIAFGNIASIMLDRAQDGMKVYIEGRLEYKDLKSHVVAFGFALDE